MGGGVTGTVIKVEHPTAVRVSITVAPDAPLGERDLRIITPGGASNHLRFFVGSLPELNEVEPNNEFAKAQQIASLPVLINGQVLPTDRDLFRFAAKAGQVIVCAVEARKILPYISDTVPGWLDATLRLYNAQGKELAFVDDYHCGPDPVLIYNVPADGEYILEVKDTINRGRGDFVYRLTLGALPYITHIFPLGGQRGTNVHVELHGANLPAPTMDFKVPSDTLPVPFATGDVKEMQEIEPNDSLQQTNRVEVPVTINGRIQKRGDMDHFIFAAQKDQTLIMEVFARRLDSPLDAIITLFNAKGEELREVDDTETGEPLIVHFADPRMDFKFPTAGDYVLRIRDVQGNGGDDHAYRLSIAPPRPDFALRVMPDAVRVGQGETILIPVTAVRKDWFGGEIIITVQNLPPGWLASGAVIFAGQNETRLTLTAPRDAATNFFAAPVIVGKAKIGEAEVVRNAEPTEDVTQAFSYHHLVPAKEYAVTVSEAPSFTLSVNQTSLSLSPEGEVQIPVKAFRKAGLKGEITLALNAPPAGITAKPAVIPADKDEIAVTIVAAKDAAVGPRPNLILTGTMKTDKETTTGYAPAVPIQIVAKKP